MISYYKIGLSALVIIVLSLTNLVVLYLLVASPPIHWWFEIAPEAGPSSVYVPGSGFSGFWFHLGALQSIPNLHDYEFYCYSSGCLSVVMAGLNMSIADAYNNAYGIQQSWLAGNMTRYDMVEKFLENILGDDDAAAADDDDEKDSSSRNTCTERDQCRSGGSGGAVESFLPKLNILVTSKGNGVEVIQPQSRAELVNALKQTTWIPFVTGEGVMRPTDTSIAAAISSTSTSTNSNQTHTATNNEEEDDNILSTTVKKDNTNFYLDGGFSRVLHPVCAYDLRVPLTWVNMMYTLHPGMSQEQVHELWQSGRNFDHPLLVARAGSSGDAAGVGSF